MNRYENIFRHETFYCYLKEIDEVEKDRIYCRHGIGHLLDVARIAYIMNLEAGSPFSKDVIYGTALLHDIGKVRQYKEKIPHEKTGALEAQRILGECGYEEAEIRQMTEAILDHRHGPDDWKRRLSVILYEADKKSRVCAYCQASETCKWADEMKNAAIFY